MGMGDCAANRPVSPRFISCLSRMKASDGYSCPPEVVYYSAIDGNTNTNSRLICTRPDPPAVSYPFVRVRSSAAGSSL